MTSDPDSEPLPGSPAGEPPSPGEETYGPVTLRRYVKDDGRALILYSRRDIAEAGGETRDGHTHETIAGRPA